MRFSGLAAGTFLGGRYRLERELGRGGMAVVYRAQDEKLGVPVALKLLMPSLEQSHLAIERLRREATAYAHLSHPNIVALHDFVVEDDMAFLAMELVEGPSLKQRILLEGRLPVEETVEIGSQIASALDAAHRQGVIHRDIKPQNVLIGAGLKVKVVDFGLARIHSLSGMTATRTTIGTPEYMAPEQIQAQPVDPRADLYALGILLYECLAGRLPFTGGDVFSVFQLHLSGTARPLSELRPDVPAWLEHLIQNCMRRRKEDRIRSAAAVHEALAGDDTPTLSGIALELGPELRQEVCPRCGGPAPELVGFCLHCGAAEATGPRTVDALVVEDKQRWERENREMLDGAARTLPAILGQRLLRRMEKRQKHDIDKLEKQAKEVEKLRGELEIPVSQLSLDERTLMLLSGRRAVQRWRRRKSSIRGFLSPVSRWIHMASKDGLWPALQQLPGWSQAGTAAFSAATVLNTVLASDGAIVTLVAATGFWVGGVHSAMKRAGAFPEEEQSGPGGILGRERIERIRALVAGRPSRRILEPLARLLAALAQTVRIARKHPETIGAVMGDLSRPVCDLVDLALGFGNKAALLEGYLAREDQIELETEIERLEQRMLESEFAATEDLGHLKSKKEAVLLKRLDLDRQLERLLTRLSLTAAEAEDLLAALYRLSLAQQSEEGRQPSAILSDLRLQLEAMEELFPSTPAA